ncbi:MAG: TonB-dependent receptor, partial [Robiginitomaculum sp.]|nr:TonB-dependent receptor [Robiginitomaculum sp.]
MSFMDTTSKIALSTLLLASIASGAQAQSTGPVLDEIIVTAQKRAESIMDVPVSVSAVSGAKIEALGIQRGEDLSALIPNFSIQTDPIGDKINIRGIQSGNNAGLEQSVSTFVDGVYRGRGMQSRLAFLDVGRVEVLRGPQGTLFGKNTIGGAINIVSAQPTDEFEGSVTGAYTFDGINEYTVKGFLSGPLSDTVRGRVAGQYRDITKGYIDNIYYNESSPQINEFGMRGTLEWDASPDTLVTARLEYGEFDRQGQNFSMIENGPLAAFGIAEGLYREANIGAIDPVLDIGSSGTHVGDILESSLTVSHAVGDAEITAIASYSAYDFQRECDCDFSALDLIRFDDSEDFEQFTFEARYASDSSQKFNYIGGAYFLYNTLLAQGDTYFNVRSTPGLGDLAIDTVLAGGCAAAGGDPNNRSCILSGLVTAFDGTPLAYTDFNRLHELDQEDTVFAVSAQATYDLSDTFSATGGLRFTTEKKTATQSAVANDFGTRNANNIVGNSALYAANSAPGFEPFSTLAEGAVHSNDLSRKENSVTWSANLEWEPVSGRMFYASAGTGFKAGGFNSFAIGP